MNAQTSGFYIVRSNVAGVSLIDRFAEALSETGCIVTAARAAGVPPEVGETFFRRICRKLGDQAR